MQTLHSLFRINTFSFHVEYNLLLFRYPPWLYMLPLYFKELKMKIVYYVYYSFCSHVLGFLLTSFPFYLKNLFSNFFRPDPLAVNSLCLPSFENVFISASCKKNIFAGYRNLGLCFFSFHFIVAISFCSHPNHSHIRNVDFPGCSPDLYLVLPLF